MVAVAYSRWSVAIGSNSKALTGKILVFWIGGRLREVVAHGDSTVFGDLIYLRLAVTRISRYTTKSSFIIQIKFYWPYCEICNIRWTWFFLLSPTLWNTFLDSLKSVDSLPSFKSVLKNVIFEYENISLVLFIYLSIYYFYFIYMYQFIFVIRNIIQVFI